MNIVSMLPDVVWRPDHESGLIRFRQRIVLPQIEMKTRKSAMSNIFETLVRENRYSCEDEIHRVQSATHVLCVVKSLICVNKYRTCKFFKKKCPKAD